MGFPGAAFETTTASLLIAKNATQALWSGCSILLLMSQEVPYDIYVGPADANEPANRGTDKLMYAETGPMFIERQDLIWFFSTFHFTSYLEWY